MAAAEKCPRRGYGQGSLGEIAPGVWQMRVLVGRDLLTGKLIQPSRRFRGTRAAAEKALQEFRAELTEQVKHGHAPNPRVTLNTIIEKHLEASDLARGTMTAYRLHHRNHIAPGLGTMAVKDLRADTLRTFYRRLAAEKKLSPSSVWGIYSLISGAITRAQREDNLTFDRRQLVAPRKPEREEKMLATNAELTAIMGEAERFTEGLERSDNDWRFLIRLACATGMRRGELMALRWTSLDADNVLSVIEGIVITPGQLEATTPKNGKSRKLTIDEETARQWRALREHRRTSCEQAGLPFTADMYVFATTLEGAAPRRPDRVTKVWTMLRDAAKANSKLEFRSLRNWHITVLRDNLGFPLEFIARRVGHDAQHGSPLSMTASYTVVVRDTDRRMAEGVAAILDDVDVSTTLAEE